MKCTPTGWTVITPNCTVDKDAGGDTGGGTGGGTGGNPNYDETLKVNATCGSQAGTPIRREEFSLKNTPNLCSK